MITGGGGLLDIHKMQQIALAAGDSLYVGIGKVYEAMYMGFAADLFGDIPYRQGADSTIRTPVYDPQLQVYADLQTQLDSAINIYLPAAGATNQGPAADGTELIYGDRGGDPSGGWRSADGAADVAVARAGGVSVAGEVIGTGLRAQTG